MQKPFVVCTLLGRGARDDLHVGLGVKNCNLAFVLISLRLQAGKKFHFLP